MNESLERICTIDQIDVSHLSESDFREKYLSIRKPLLIRNGVQLWPAMQKWSAEYFIGLWFIYFYGVFLSYFYRKAWKSQCMGKLQTFKIDSLS